MPSSIVLMHNSLIHFYLQFDQHGFFVVVVIIFRLLIYCISTEEDCIDYTTVSTIAVDNSLKIYLELLVLDALMSFEVSQVSNC